MKFKIKKLNIKKEITYPRLMKATHSDTIVLFDSLKSGICLNPEEGDTSNQYSYCWEMSNFEDFDGEVVLSND